MQMNIINKKEEPLLSRTMITATLEFEKATPSYPEVTSLMASQLKIDDKLVAIRHIYNSFGAKKAEVIAYVYADENKKQFIEPKAKEKKDKKAKEAKKE
ncbi:hypothetical protein J4448_06790 [Candidatus Woesearchaeota archaeon]|nr:hypothetical protein [Candidatus Woesearchaeota archaeon]